MTPSAIRHAVPLIAGLVALVAACADQPETWHTEDGYRWRSTRPSARGEGFSVMPAGRTGIEFENRISDARRLEHPNTLVGAGVALGDVDSDGRVDIYLASTDGPNALYRNTGGWRFEEVAADAGVAADDRASTGAALADVDGDGDLDLVLTALGGPNGLFINDGTGHFTEESDARGLASTAGSTTATLADVDGDRDLDLYVTNYKTVHAEDLFPPTERAFDQVVYEVDGRWQVAPRFREHYRVQVLEDYGIVARVERGEPDQLLLNDGTGHFQAVSWTGGRFLDPDGTPLQEVPDRFGLAARFYDVDGDGDPDLYVCNDFEDPDFFWINDGTGVFQEIPRLAVRATSNAAMAVDFADVDRNGTVDFLLVDMRSRGREGLLRRLPSHTSLPKLVGKIDDRPQLQRNTLFLNRGDLTFAQIAEYAGVEASDWTWATMFIDVDLDGYEDILGGNGHIWDVQDADSDMRARRQMRGRDWQRARLLYPPMDQHNPAFRNNGDSTFSPAHLEWGYGEEADVSHGLAAGDLDGDGDLDVVVNRVDRPAAVYRNDARAPRLAVRLVGLPTNTHGVGARIRVTGGSLPLQEREVTAGGLYLSSSDAALSFAADRDDLHTIEVRWRSGAISSISNVRANRMYEIQEPSSGSLADPVDAPAPIDTRARFTDVSDLLAHRHFESDYDDYERQPLLPTMLSRLGPGLMWHDLDGDGAEDLVVPAGRGGQTTILFNRASGFAPVALPRAAGGDHTTTLAIPGVAGDPSLLIGQSTFEDTTGSLPPLLRVGIDGMGRPSEGEPVLASGHPAAVGPMATADIDSDGDLDVFVGARVTPGRFPESAPSRLLLNEDGDLTEPDSATGILPANLGNVSDALFSDVDGDGDPDLVIARDLGPVALLINQGGRFTEASAEWGLSGDVSRWNAVAAGDFDGDGRMDLVATSWGRNTPWRASTEVPLRIYHGDFDGNGSVDLIEAVYDPARGGDVPLVPFQTVRAAIPSVELRVTTFNEYVEATFEELFGPIDAFAVTALTTFEHRILLNRGGRFESRPLSSAAQLAPAFGVAVGDVDADGREDLFLAQNFFATAQDVPRFDAGRGLLLLGRGDGEFTPMLGSQTGIAVYGEQRGAAMADFDGDGRVDLAVAQNGAATKLYRNESARAGLRVRLVGPPANPTAIGAVIRLIGSAGHGPAREVRSGGGYWSTPGPVQVMGKPMGLRAVWVRWPGGREEQFPIEQSADSVILRPGDGTNRP